MTLSCDLAPEVALGSGLMVVVERDWWKVEVEAVGCDGRQSLWLNDADKHDAQVRHVLLMYYVVVETTVGKPTLLVYQLCTVMQQMPYYMAQPMASVAGTCAQTTAMTGIALVVPASVLHAADNQYDPWRHCVYCEDASMVMGLRSSEALHDEVAY